MRLASPDKTPPREPRPEMRQTTEPTNAKEWEASFYDMGDLAAWHQRRANAAEAEVVRLRRIEEAADRFANWNEPRIVPTEEFPDQWAALDELRRSLHG